MGEVIAMGKFSGIDAAKINGGGKYFDPGHYFVEVIRIFTMQSRKREDLFIAECKVIESNAPGCPAGVRCSQVIKMSQDAAMGNIKALLASANGMDPSDEKSLNAVTGWEEIAELAVSDQNPLAGTILELTATNVKTREGNDFTKHYWTPVADAVAAELRGRGVVLEDAD